MRFDCVIFDFDGTTADTSPGVMSSLRHAFSAIGEPDPGDEVLRRFVGPSLHSSFTSIMGYDDEKAERAIAAYREVYSGGGVIDCRLYDGIDRLFHRIKAAGAALCIASSKPQVMLDRVAAHFGLDKLADVVLGPPLNKRENDKADIISRAVRGDRPVMVGDTVFDIEGAAKAGIPSIAVTYGFAPKADLLAKNPTYMADTVAEVETIIFDK